MSYLNDLLANITRDSEEERRKAACRNLTTGLFFGALIGVTAGILLAPKSGKETRKDIADKTADTVEQLKEAINEYVNEVQTRIEAADNGLYDNIEEIESDDRAD